MFCKLVKEEKYHYSTGTKYAFRGDIDTAVLFFKMIIVISQFQYLLFVIFNMFRSKVQKSACTLQYVVKSKRGLNSLYWEYVLYTPTHRVCGRPGVPLVFEGKYKCSSIGQSF